MIIINFFIYFLIFYIGASVGSFLTVLSYRIPRGQNWITKRSYCPKCKNILPVKSLFPIFSWLIQKGKCINCEEKISIRYFIIELISGISFLFIYKMFPLFNWMTFYAIILFAVFFLMCIIDIEEMIIPTFIQVALLILGIIYVAKSDLPIIYHLSSAFCYWLLLYLASLFINKQKNVESLGNADPKIVAIMGFVLGYDYLYYFYLFSGVIACIYGTIFNKISKSETKQFPFAPALATAFVLTLLLKHNYYHFTLNLVELFF